MTTDWHQNRDLLEARLVVVFAIGALVGAVMAANARTRTRFVADHFLVTSWIEWRLLVRVAD